MRCFVEKIGFAAISATLMLPYILYPGNSSLKLFHTLTVMHFGTILHPHVPWHFCTLAMPG